MYWKIMQYENSGRAAKSMFFYVRKRENEKRSSKLYTIIIYISATYDNILGVL